MKYEDFSAGSYYDRSRGGWGRLPVPTSFLEDQQTAFKLHLSQGLGGTIFSYLRQKAQGEDGSELLTPQQIAEEYPSLTNPILTATKRGEVEYIAERDQFETYLGNQLKMGMGRGSWGWARTLPGAMAAGFLDPMNWALAMGTYGVLSSVGPTRKLLTNARLAKSAWKRRGYAGIFAALDGLANGVAYGSLLAAVREKGNRHWEATDIVAESIFSTGFGGVFGLAGHEFFEKVREGMVMRQKGDGAFWTNVAQWQRDKGRLKRPDEYMLHNPPLDLMNMMKFAKGRDRKLYSVPQDKMRPVDVGLLEGAGAERIVDLPEERILTAKAGFRREDTIGGGRGIKATRKGVRELAGLKLGRSVPYHEGVWGSYAKNVERPDRLYLALSRQGVVRPEGFGEGRMVLGNTPEMAIQAHLLMGGKDRTDWDVVELFIDRKRAENKIWDMDKISEDPDTYLRREGLAIRPDLMDGSSKQLVLEKHMESRKDVLGQGWFEGNEGYFILKKDKLEKVISSVSREYKHYEMKKGPEKLSDGEIQEMLDILAGKTEDSAPPQVNMLLKDYMKSFMDITVKSGTFFDDYVKRIPGTEIEMVGSYPAWLHPKIKGLKGSPWVPLKQWFTGELGEGVDMSKGIMHNVSALMAERGRDEAEAFLNTLKASGAVEFPRALKGLEGRPETAWFFVEDMEGRVRALKGKDSKVERRSVLDELKEGSNSGEPLDLEGVRISLPRRTLDLGIHPQAMFHEEARMLANLVEAGIVRPRTNVFSNTTVLEEITGGIGPIVGKMEVPYKKLLDDLGYYRVGFRNTKGEMVYWEIGDKGRGPVEISGRDLLERLDKLETSHEPKVVEGNREVPEQDRAMSQRLSEMAGFGEKGYVARLVGDMKDRSKYGASSYTALDTLRSEYVGHWKTMSTTDAGEQAHIDAVRNMRQIVHDLEKMHTLLVAVEEGGLDTSGVLDKGIELQNMLVYSPEVPFKAMGGDNAQAVANSIERQFKVSLIRRVEEEGGSDLFDMFRKGMLDEDIRKIHRWSEEQKVKREGKMGTATEDGRESLMASPNAWKVYNVLVEVMGNLQEKAILGGFYRPARRGIYIGVRSYDSAKMNKWGMEVWAKDLEEMAGVARKEAEELYLAQTRPTLPEPGYKSIANMKEFLVKGRKLEFKTAGDEYKFLQKYGRSGAPVENRLMKFLHMETQSNVLMGAMQAIERDSGVIGVSRVLGSRPFLALELAGNTLWKKYDTGAGGNIITRTGLNTMLKISRQMVKDMVFGPERGVSVFGNSRRVIQGAMNAAVLGASSPVAFMGDMVTSAAHYSALKGEGNLLGLLSNTFKTWFDRFRFGNPLDKSRRMEVSRRMYSMLESDLGHLKGRIADSELSGLWSWWEGLVMRSQLLPYVTDVGKSSNAHLSSQLMGEAFGKTWEGLNPRFRRVLETHGISEVDWKFMRGLPGIVDTSADGIPRVWNDQVLAALTAAESEGLLARGRGEDLFRRYETFVGETAYTKGSVRPGYWERALLDPDIDNNGFTFNAWKLVSQFWGVAMAAWRSMADAGNPKVMGVRAGLVHQGMGRILAYSTVMGILTIYMQDLIRGKTFRDLGDTSLWMDGMMKGGAFGLAGDFLLGERVERKEGFLGGFMGPFMTGPAYELVALTHTVPDVVMGSAEGRDKMLNHGRRLLKQSSPSLGPAHVFLMNTMFLESLGALGGSRESRQAVKSRLKKVNQEFLVL